MDKKDTDLLTKPNFADEFLSTQTSVTIRAVMFKPPTYNEAVELSNCYPLTPPPTYTKLPAPIPPIENPIEETFSTQPPTNANTKHDCWAIAHNGCVPPNAVQAGYEIDQSRNYVGRAYHSGEFLPGKYVPKDRCTYVLHQGNEVRKTSCEVLIGSHNQFIWVPVTKTLPLGAVKVDRNSREMHFYIGRADYNGSVLCGKFQSSNNCLYLTSKGQDIQITNNIEILVRKDEYDFIH